MHLRQGKAGFSLAAVSLSRCLAHLSWRPEPSPNLQSTKNDPSPHINLPVVPRVLTDLYACVYVFQDQMIGAE